MDVLESGGPGFAAAWEEAVGAFTQASYYYGPRFRSYARAFSGARLAADRSFILFEGGRPVALCPLFLESPGGVRQLTYDGSFERAPLINPSLSSGDRRRVEAESFRRIADEAKRAGALRHMVMIDPLTVLDDPPNENPLLRYGYADASIGSQLIELGASESDLFSAVRERYRTMIRRQREDTPCEIVDHRRPDDGAHRRYVEAHKTSSPLPPRSDETYDLQREMLHRDEAALFHKRGEDGARAFMYFLHRNGAAYYGFGLRHGAGVEMHSLVWEAVVYYRGRGFRAIELGWLRPGGSMKERQLSHFYRGFGGRTVTLWRGVRAFA